LVKLRSLLTRPALGEQKCPLGGKAPPETMPGSAAADTTEGPRVCGAPAGPGGGTSGVFFKKKGEKEPGNKCRPRKPQRGGPRRSVRTLKKGCQGPKRREGKHLRSGSDAPQGREKLKKDACGNYRLLFLVVPQSYLGKERKKGCQADEVVSVTLRCPSPTSTKGG